MTFKDSSRFTVVSKAFQVLSGEAHSLPKQPPTKLTNTFTDPQKRAAYDRHGSDPEDRYAGMRQARSPGFGMARGGPASPFGDEMSAEDLFNMFFGGGSMGGGPFGQAAFDGPGTYSLCGSLRAWNDKLICFRSIHGIIWSWWLPYHPRPDRTSRRGWGRKYQYKWQHRITPFSTCPTPPTPAPLRIFILVSPPKPLCNTTYTRP